MRLYVAVTSNVQRIQNFLNATENIGVLSMYNISLLSTRNAYIQRIVNDIRMH